MAKNNSDVPELGTPLHDAPLALATDGTALANVAHLLRGEDAIELLRRALQSERQVFIGVALSEKEMVDTKKRIDDAAAEIVAMAVKLV